MTFRPSGIDITIKQDLASGSGRLDTTLNVDPIVTKDGHRVIMTDIGDICFGKIDPGVTSLEEIISWTGMDVSSPDYTVLTGCVWGYNEYDGTGDVNANKKSHFSGSRFIITNDDHFLNTQYIDKDSDQTITGMKSVPAPTANGHITNKQYVDGIITGVTGTATSTSNGTTKMSSNPSITSNPVALNNEEVSAIVEQVQETQNAVQVVGEANATTKANKIFQSIIAGKTSITGVRLYKTADTGTFTGTVTIDLFANSSTNPTGSSLATITISNATWLALPVGEFEALFGTAYTTAIGTTYHIGISCSTADNSNHPNLGTNSAGGYTSGSVKRWNVTDGYVAIATIDLYFKTLTTGVNKVVRANSSGKISKSYIDIETTNPGLKFTGNKLDTKLKTSGGVLSDSDGLYVDTGTTDGKIVQMTTGDKLPAVDGSQLTNILLPIMVSASNNLKFSNDTEYTRTGESQGLKNMKSNYVALSGTYRIKFDFNGSGSDYATIYKNGTTYGTNRTGAGGYTTFSQDLYFMAGDALEIKVYQGLNYETISIKNLRLYFDASNVYAQ